MATDATSDDALTRMQKHWDARAPRYTDTANKRITLQCALQLYAHMQLDTAKNVLEVAAGAGLCAREALKMLAETPGKKTFVVTDLSPVMVGMAQENLRDAIAATRDHVDVTVREANGQDLVGIESASIDRYLSSLCLQLAPDPNALLREARRVLTPDGLAGFTIWARPECTGLFTIEAQVGKATGTGTGAEHPNFALGRDLVALRQQFRDAGFSKVMIWPFLCALELWSAEEFGSFFHETFFLAVDNDELRAERRAVATRLAAQWLEEKQIPIGLETYIIIARP